MNKISVKKLLPDALNIRRESFIGALTVIVAIFAPQIFHIIGTFSGVGAALGESLLPMHLPIALGAFFLSPVTALIAAAVAPVASNLLTAMPTAAMLPYIISEVVALSLSISILRKFFSALPTVAFSIVLSRLIKIFIVFIAVRFFSADNISVGAIVAITAKGAFGAILQLSFVPLMVYYIKHK